MVIEYIGVARSSKHWKLEMAQHERDRLQEAEDLATISRAATSTLELDSIFASVAEALQRYVQYDRLVISLVQPNGEIKRDFVTGIGSQEYGNETLIVGAEDQLERRPDGSVIIGDPAGPFKPDPHMRGLGLNSWAEVVIDSFDGPIGYLSVRSKQINAYANSDIERLTRAADTIAPSIINARLHAQTQEELNLRNVLAEVARIATSALDIDEVYDDITRTIAPIIPADRVAITSYSPDGDRVTTEFLSGRAIPGYGLHAVNDNPPEIARFIFSLKSAFIVDEEFVEIYPAVASQYQYGIDSGFNSWMLAPLVWKDKVIGALHFRDSKHDVYNDNHTRIATLFAQQISGAVASSLNYRQERRATEIQTALSNISVAASQNLELQHVYSSVADELSHLLHYDRFAIVLYDRDNETLTVDYNRGLTPEGDYPGVQIEPKQRSRSWQWHLEQDLEAKPTPRDIAMESLGLKSWIQAPIGLQQDGPDGFLSIRSLNENEYTDEDARLLEEIARQITPAIQNALLYKQSVELNEQRQRANALDEENIELQRIADARSQFLSTVSHELRTPLTSISAFADILGRNRPDNLDDSQQLQIDAIKRSTATLTGLIDDLLDVSRADVQQLKIERAPFSFAQLLDETAAEAVQTLAPKKQTITIEKPNGAISIEADRARITQVLNNLISNASKYSSIESEITLCIETTDGKLTVSVTDTGIGIAPNDIPSVFTPFFRASDAETQSQQGTGLGLAIVKTIVELHLGEITVESELDEGTTVTFWLPGLLPA